MKTYVTFGQDHTHNIKGKIIDKDCVAVIECDNPADGRQKAFDLFGNKFCFEYPESQWTDAKMTYFPRGYINFE